MSMKTEKTIIEYRKSYEDGFASTLLLSVDTENPIATLTYSSNQTQVTIPIPITSIPNASAFFNEVNGDESLQALVEKFTVAPPEIIEGVTQSDDETPQAAS